MTEEEPPSIDGLAASLDFVWLFVCLQLVILMQAGFAAYEVGAIRSSSAQSILLKNIGDATISLVAWLATGYAIANGDDRKGITGGTFFFLSGRPFERINEGDPASAFLRCLYGWSFAATCTTIVSGAVADRIYVKAYFTYAFLTSAFFYPFVAHAVWADEGWASPKRESPLFGCGVIDFAGSGVVHMLGGGIGGVMACVIPNRRGRFFKANERQGDIQNHTNVAQLNEASFRPNDTAWMTLGCFLLWFGWYGFNCGSTLQISTLGYRTAAGRAALNTSIGAGIGCVSSMIFERIYHTCSPEYRQSLDVEDALHLVPNGNGTLTAYQEQLNQEHQAAHTGFKWPLSTQMSLHGAACNGILAGLVGITAGCATMSYWSAVGVSIGSAFVYHVTYRGFICLRVDDAVNAAAVHFSCGLWGLLAAGFTTSSAAARADIGYPDKESCSRDNQFVANALMALAILFYVVVCSGIIWTVLIWLGFAEKTAGANEFPEQMDRNLIDLQDNMNRQLQANNVLVETLKRRVDRLQETSIQEAKRFSRPTILPSASEDNNQEEAEENDII